MRALCRSRGHPYRAFPQHPAQLPKLAGFQEVNRKALKVSKIWQRSGRRLLKPDPHGKLGFVSVRL